MGTDEAVTTLSRRGVLMGLAALLVTMQTHAAAMSRVDRKALIRTRHSQMRRTVDVSMVYGGSRVDAALREADASSHHATHPARPDHSR